MRFSVTDGDNLGSSRAPHLEGSNSRDARLHEAMRAERLVQAARAREPGAFDALVRRYRPRVFALALHMTGSVSDADDVVQEAFLRAYQQITAFEGRSQFFTWLYRIALNQALALERSRKRSRVLCGVSDDRIEAALTVDAADDPRSILELRESYSLLLRALDSLSPVLRTTVVLIALQGLSYREAAVVLGTEEGTIAWRVHEARRRLYETVQRLSRVRANGSRLSAARCYALLQRLVSMTPKPAPAS